MELNSPDFLRRLRLKLQIHLIPILNGVNWALLLMCFNHLYFLIRSLLVWLPEEILEFGRAVVVLLYFQKLSPGYLSNFFLARMLSGDYEMEFEEPFPRTLQLLLPSYMILANIMTIMVTKDNMEILEAPLRLLSTYPALVIRLLYTLLLMKVLRYIQPEISIGYFGPSMTGGLVRIMTTPVELGIILWRRILSSTIFLKPGQANKYQGDAVYRYHPLGERRSFRLLKLARVGLRISASLEHFPLDGCPKYWAVSYVWGSGIMDHNLKLGNSPATSLPITKSCADVLATLCPFQTTKYLWIDAICINQADNEEKAVQVPLMAEIYSGAHQVIGYLSPKDAINPYLGYLDALSSEFLFDVIRYLRCTVNDKTFRLPFRHRILDWEAFCYLLSHPYWQRAWILQEILLSKKMILLHGQASFSWNQYRYAVKQLYERLQFTKVSGIEGLFQQVPQMFMLLVAMNDRLDMLTDHKNTISSKERDQWPSLAQTVGRSYRVHSAMPRDQIFAFLSLASDRDAPALQPNYQDAVTDEEIFTRVALHYLAKGDLNFFLDAGLGYHDVGPRLNYPTWLCILPKPMRPREGSLAVLEARKKRYQLEYRVSMDEKVLSLRGCLIDRLVAVCENSLARPPAQKYHDYQATHPEATASEWMGVFSRELSNTETQSKNLVNYLYQANQLVQQHVPHTYRDMSPRDAAFDSAWFMGWDARYVSTALSESGMQVDASADGATITTQHIERLNQLIKNGSLRSEQAPMTHVTAYEFAVTSGGLMAWVPQGARPGDVLCYFKGVDVPFLLRPRTEEYGETKEYQLYGDSYIHGLVHRKDDISEEWFDIA